MFLVNITIKERVSEGFPFRLGRKVLKFLGLSTFHTIRNPKTDQAVDSDQNTYINLFTLCSPHTLQVPCDQTNNICNILIFELF